MVPVAASSEAGDGRQITQSELAGVWDPHGRQRNHVDCRMAQRPTVRRPLGCFR